MPKTFLGGILKKMLKNFLFGPNKILLFIAIIIIVAGVLIYALFPKEPQPTAPPPVQIFSPLQKTSINETTKTTIEKLPGLINVQGLPDGSIQYNYSSQIPQRPNMIITKNNVAIFERDLLPEDPDAKGYAKISDYIKKLGEPEKIIQGSKFYGPFISTYIYSSKGLAIIGNSNTDEAYEIQTFSPLTPDNYINTFGSDISQITPQPEAPIENE